MFNKNEHAQEAERCQELAKRFAGIPQLRIAYQAYQAAADYHREAAKEKSCSITN